MIDYETETRAAYRSPDRAASYKRYNTTAWSWGRVATWLEQRAVRRLLGTRRWNASDVVLDAPCGTGILGRTLAAYPSRVVASDISREMMDLADGEYAPDRLTGFVQADITSVPFATGRFSAVITLGFMHRVPEHVRVGALAELARVCSDIAVISFSLASRSQRVKQRVLRALRPGHVPAPWAIARREAEAEITAAGFRIVRRVAVAPLLSAESLYLLRVDRAKT